MSAELNVERLTQLARSPRAIAAAGTLLGLLSCRWLNSWLSSRALNSVEDRTWDWSKEIVLLTGGSSGIGAVIATKLAEKRVKVIIVDVHPPKSNLRTYHSSRFPCLMNLLIYSSHRS